MKKILILGENSYIGSAFENYAKKFPEKYTVTTISLRGEGWQNYDMSNYDVAFNVTGIAHADIEKVTEEQKKLYYQVNTELAINVAEKYKSDRNGKKSQYIYMSSIIVYGNDGSNQVINKKTIPKPSNFYGDSKLQAEKGLFGLRSADFLITILRPPMIYGPKSKGNYRVLEKIAKHTRIFPVVKNQRSVLSLNVLCKFIKEKIDKCEFGIFFPQDDQYKSTSQMIMEIGKKNGKKIFLIPGFDWLVFLTKHCPGRIGKLAIKAFGSVVYEMND